MIIIFVHGWSVTHTNTYGDLPQSLASDASKNGLSINIQHVHLGKYVSFHDEVTLDDIARGLDRALRDLPGNAQNIKEFSCITHSTGGPVVRYWIDKYYGASGLAELPLKHLVMLAPANHGSSLAILGKQRVGRIKAWFSGVEPGQRVLDWLALGSKGQWDLNEAFLKYKSASNNFFPFVLTGQGIDTSFYDFLNSYLVEPGSDGVVRVAGANMNCRYLSLSQTDILIDDSTNIYRLETTTSKPVRMPAPVPIAVLSQFSHSGSDMGIMANKKSYAHHSVVVAEILKCFQVNDKDTYEQRRKDFVQLTQAEQHKVPKGKDKVIAQYSMLVFRVHDHAGEIIKHDDYDLFLLGGAAYKENGLPSGFFVDKQMNETTHSLVYYVNANKMSEMKDGLFGIRIVARPNKGFSYYNAVEYRSEGLAVEKVFAPNETTYIDVTLTRQVDKNVFRFAPASEPHASFKNVKPSGEVV
jgi:hypothetical protein